MRNITARSLDQIRLSDLENHEAALKQELRYMKFTGETAYWIDAMEELKCIQSKIDALLYKMSNQQNTQ